MLFNSLSFAVFIIIVFAIYWIMPHETRWILLLVASYYFYMSWNAKYVFLILLTTVVSYSSAILIDREANRYKKRIILIGTLAVCLGVLFVFKYFNFISKSTVELLQLFTIQMDPIVLDIVLPVGISFYTFQTLSYVVDVYKGDVEVEKHFGYYALFISFFPQLVAGPIERTINLLPQIKEERFFNYEQASYGLKLMAWGYFKKIVIADNLSRYVSLVYTAPKNYSGFALVLATLFFTIQIYCDFSGYSDIAIGTAKLLGINLMTNFKSPYFSQSIKEFWGRWHISLSTWFRDYVYIPMGGNRKGKIRHAINLVITFLVSGLWHGANWTYVCWGGIHGIGQVIESMFVPTSRLKKRSAGFIWWMRVILVFTFSTFALIFFVSNSISDATYVITNLFSGIATPVKYLREGLTSLGFNLMLNKIELLFLAPSLLILFMFDYESLKCDVIEKISSNRASIRWSIYVLFLMWMIMNIASTNKSEFIYFQF